MDSEVKSIMQWIKVCLADDDYFKTMKETFVARHMSLEPPPRQRLEKLDEVYEDDLGVQSD